jgi:hypothetical protein
MIFIEIIFLYFNRKKKRQKTRDEKQFSAPFYLQQNTRTLHAYFAADQKEHATFSISAVDAH